MSILTREKQTEHINKIVNLIKRDSINKNIKKFIERNEKNIELQKFS